jgi:glycosyltransferase involved in cell wall biosynthesis
MIVHGPYPVGEPRVAREAAAARSAGFEVDVVAMRRKGEPARENVDGVEVVRLPLERRRGAGVAGILLEYVGFTLLASAAVAKREFGRRYDIVQVHNPPDFLIAAAFVPRLAGARVVLDVHDLSPHMFGSRFRAGRATTAARRALLGVQSVATRFADAVLTVHAPYGRELVRQGVPEDKVTVVMNTLDERLLPAARASEPGLFRIVYHGTVTRPYGLGLLVDAAGRLRDEGVLYRVELYGEGDAVAELRGQVAAAGLEDRFEVSGTYLPHEETLARVAGASVGVIPNLPGELNRFALSSKLFEYVALGIPVVCADLPTLREHFSAEEVLFFRAGDADSLAEALLAVARKPEAAAERAERARQRYEDYRWPVQAARYTSVLERLVS